MNKLKQYLWNILIATDESANTILGGDPQETISSRMAKLIKANKCKLCKVICSILNLLQPGHCSKSEEDNVGSKTIIK